MKGYRLGVNMWASLDEVPLGIKLAAQAFPKMKLLQQAPPDAPHGAGNWFRINPFGTKDPWNYAPDYVANTRADVDAIAEDPIFAAVFGKRLLWKHARKFMSPIEFRNRNRQWIDRARRFQGSSNTAPGVPKEILEHWDILVAEWLPSLGKLYWIKFPSGWYGYAPESLVGTNEVGIQLSNIMDPTLQDNALVHAQVKYVEHGIIPTKIMPSFPPSRRDNIDYETMVREHEVMAEQAIAV